MIAAVLVHELTPQDLLVLAGLAWVAGLGLVVAMIRRQWRER